jgi:hypothetical protein
MGKTGIIHLGFGLSRAKFGFSYDGRTPGFSRGRQGI